MSNAKYLNSDPVPNLTFPPNRCHQIGWVSGLVKAPRASCFQVHGSMRSLFASIDLCNVRARVFASVQQLHDTDTRQAAGAEERRLNWALLKSAVAGSAVRDADAALRVTALRCSPPPPATVPQRLVSRLFAGRLTALHRRNQQDNASIMLAAGCLLFSAVCTGTENFFI